MKTLAIGEGPSVTLMVITIAVISCGVVGVILRLAVLRPYWLVADRQTDRHRTTAYAALA